MTNPQLSTSHYLHQFLRSTKDALRWLISPCKPHTFQIEISAPQIVQSLSWQLGTSSGGFMGGKEKQLYQFFPSAQLFFFIFNWKHFSHRLGMVSKISKISPQGASNRQPLGLDQLEGGCLSGESVPLIFTFPSRFQKDTPLLSDGKDGGNIHTNQFNLNLKTRVKGPNQMEMMTTNSAKLQIVNQYSLVLPANSIGKAQDDTQILLVAGKKSKERKEEYHSINVPSPEAMRRKATLLLPSPLKCTTQHPALGADVQRSKNLAGMYRHGSVELIELTRPAFQRGVPILEATSQ